MLYDLEKILYYSHITLVKFWKITTNEKIFIKFIKQLDNIEAMSFNSIKHTKTALEYQQEHNSKVQL